MNTITKKAIIFNDDPDILSICRYILEEMRWIVHSFIDCINIEEKVANIFPDVILMDVWIPDDGVLSLRSDLKTTEIFL